MNFRILVIFLLLFILQSCSIKQSIVQAPIITKIDNKIVKLKVLDVECEECAHSVEQASKGVPGVINANYVYLGTDYENGILEIEISPEGGLNLGLMKKVLNSVGFEIKT